MIRAAIVGLGWWGKHMVRRMKEVYPRAIALVERGLVDVRSVVSHRYPLSQVEDAFTTASSCPVTPSCSSTTRRSEHRVRPRDLRRQTKECLTRKPPRRRKADRLQHSNALQADPRRKREVATPRGPPPHQRLPSLARPQPSLRASSRIRRGPRARIRRRGQKVRTKGRKARGQPRTQSKVQEKGK